jgi:dihydrofolate synthase/folylpolyglutamate synthase
VSGGAFERLTALRGQSVELGLANVTRLLDRLDHPEREFPAVHVAGTNGKGSVCAMVAAALSATGRRVGLLTSPHLVDFAERIRVDGHPIREEDAALALDAMTSTGGELDASFFEVTTALAFEHFRQSRVDIAVLEVGLGGRLDATSVCHPAVTVVTGIDLDHTKTLGGSLAEIAREKAGILRPGVPLVLGEMQPAPREACEEIARRRGVPVLRVDEEVELRVLSNNWDGLTARIRLPGDPEREVFTPLPGVHQSRNLATAALAARLVDSRPEALDLLLGGFGRTQWPGRLRKVAGNPVRVYDVAHNAAGVAALSHSLVELGLPEGSVLVLGVLGDKDLSEMATRLSGVFRRAVTATPPHPVRARPAEETASALAAAGMNVDWRESVADAVAFARESLPAGAWVVVAGSLFTVGAAMRAFGDPVDTPGPAEEPAPAGAWEG